MRQRRARLRSPRAVVEAAVPARLELARAPAASFAATLALAAGAELALPPATWCSSHDDRPWMRMFHNARAWV